MDEKIFYVDEEENVYKFLGHLTDGLLSLRNIFSEEHYIADPNEVKSIVSTDLIRALIQKETDVNNALHAEISSRNHMDMTAEEKAIMKGLMIGSHVVHSRKLKI